MMPTEAQPKPNRSLTEGSCCALVARPNGWVGLFFAFLQANVWVVQQVTNGQEVRWSLNVDNFSRGIWRLC